MQKRIRKHPKIKIISVLILVLFMVPSIIKRGNAIKTYLGIEDKLPVNVGPIIASTEKTK